jgi:hypothetical protein
MATAMASNGLASGSNDGGDDDMFYMEDVTFVDLKVLCPGGIFNTQVADATMRAPMPGYSGDTTYNNGYVRLIAPDGTTKNLVVEYSNRPQRFIDVLQYTVNGKTFVVSFMISISYTASYSNFDNFTTSKYTPKCENISWFAA